MKILLKIQSDRFNCELTLSEAKALRLAENLLKEYKRMYFIEIKKYVGAKAINRALKRYYVNEFSFPDSNFMKVQFIHV